MGWARKQSGGNSSAGAVTSLTATLGLASVAGDLIVVGVAFYNSATNTAAVTDDKGNVYTQVGTYQTAGAGRLAVFVCPNILASPTPQITATISGLAFTDLCAIEYSGLAVAAQPDGTNGANGASTAADSGSVPVAAANELLVSFTSQSTNSTATITPGGGATSVYDAHTAAMPLAASELNVSAATDGTFTYSSSVAWMCAAVSLKLSAATTVTVSFSVPVEILATVQSSPSVPAEWLATIAASSSLPVEWLGTIQPTVSFPAEWLGTVNASPAAIAEWLSTVAPVATLPAEWLSTVQPASTIPLEWTGVATAPDAVFSLGARGDVFILSARGDVFRIPGPAGR